MADFNQDQMFCTRDDVFAAAGYTFDGDSVPSDTHVSKFAEWVRGEIVLATERAGQRYDPPASGVTDEDVRQVLVAANAIGAAYEAWTRIAASGDSKAEAMRDQLRDRWIMYVGNEQVGGTIPGIIKDTIETSANSRLLANDVTTGEVTLKSLSVERNIEPVFRMGEVD